MTDVFKEQIVKRKPPFRNVLIRVGLIFAVIIIVFLSFLLLQGFGAVIAMGAAFGAAYVMSFLNVEYEYALTNGELDIDIIYNKARRKRQISVNVKEFEIMAHIDDKAHEHTFTTAQVTRDFSSGTPGNDTYRFLTIINGKKTIVIFDPNEKMLKAISSVISRRKLHLRPGVVLVS